MKYEIFLKFAKATKFEEKQWFLLWRTWRFEKADYMEDALNEYLALNPKVKNVREMFRSENNIGVILKKYRKLRVVTKEGVQENLYNMPRILANCDHERDSNQLETIYYPLVYSPCPKCFATVKMMSSEGVWRCVCGKTWIDPFYNVEEIQRIRGIVDDTTPKENIEKIKKQSELPY